MINDIRSNKSATIFNCVPSVKPIPLRKSSSNQQQNSNDLVYSNYRNGNKRKNANHGHNHLIAKYDSLYEKIKIEKVMADSKNKVGRNRSTNGNINKRQGSSESRQRQSINEIYQKGELGYKEQTVMRRLESQILPDQQNIKEQVDITLYGVVD